MDFFVTIPEGMRGFDYRIDLSTNRPVVPEGLPTDYVIQVLQCPANEIRVPQYHQCE